MAKMISVASGFQYSVNIGYDLNSDEKLKNFIPTKSALELLEEIVLSTYPASTDRARVLIGAYGKGKSHIILMILSILMKRDLALFEKMLPKIRENPQLEQIINNYYDSDNKILPVIISGSNTSLTQAFLLALQRTLSDNDLMDIMPDTNYKAAITVIERWKAAFPETYQKLEQSLDMPVDVSQKLMTNRYSGDENKKDVHERDVEYLKKCRKSAEYACEKLGWHRVCCSESGEPKSIDAISQEIFTIIKGNL